MALRDYTFKKISGEKVTDIISYIKEHLEEDPYLTVTVGCDSIQKRKAIYVVTITMYNSFLKKGVHVLYKRLYVDGILDIFTRLCNESVYIEEIANYITDNVQHTRLDIDEFSRKSYKFHIMNEDGKYNYIPYYNQKEFIKNISLSDEDLNKEYKLVDLHVDYNNMENSFVNGQFKDHKSYAVHSAMIPYLRGLNYRVWSKPTSSASVAADAVLNKVAFNPKSTEIRPKKRGRRQHRKTNR